MNARDPQSSSSHADARTLFTIALWFGMAAGVLEAATLFGTQWRLPQWQSLGRRAVVVDANIFWASPVVSVFLFLLVALLLLPFTAMLRRVSWSVLAAGVFATLGFYEILSATGYMRERAVVILSLGLGITVARGLRRHPAARVAFLKKTLKPLAGATLAICLAAATGYRVREWLWQRQLPQAPPGAPNVLLIVVDTLRADRVGAYGYARPTSPFFDSLARESVLFENAFADSSWTLPSHVSFFTGRAPHEHQAVDGLAPYDGRFETLAQFLSSRGYATAGFVSNTFFATPAHGMAIGFQRYESTFTGPLDAFRRTVLGRKFEQYLSQRIPVRERRARMDVSEVNQRFLRWTGARPTRPFFAFLNYMNMHSPLNPPPDLRRAFATTGGPPASDAPQEPNGPGRGVYRRPSEGYDASLAHIDREMAKLFAELQRRGLDRNLLLVVLSDHGESLGEHDLIGHRSSLYLEQIRVPLLIKFPEKLPRGVRVPGAVGLRALPATVAGLAGFAQQPFSGTPWTVCLASGACPDGPVVSEVAGAHSEQAEPNWPVHQGWVRSVITSRWHFLLQQDGQTELYEWPVDPAETNNLVKDERWRALVAQFRAQLETLPPPEPAAAR